MSFTNEPTTASTTGFSAAHYRAAMGPGYQAATFTDQAILTSRTPSVIRPPAPSLLQLARQTLSLRPRLRRTPRNIGARTQQRVLLSTALIRS